jgi:acetyltransferase-like isoleucine patch superfamily enzyme
MEPFKKVMNSYYYSGEELESFGFKAIGNNVFISRKASIYSADKIEIGNNVRIDDFCLISAGAGGVKLGNYIHISAHSSLVGQGRITLFDFSGISSRVSIFSSNDNYLGTTMTNPMLPSQYTGVTHADVVIGKHAIVGSGSVILPGVILETGVAIGALSMVQENCEEFYIYSGNPLKKLFRRSRNLLKLEDEFLKTFLEKK